MPEAVNVPASFDWQFANDPSNIDVSARSTHCLLIVRIVGHEKKGDIPETTQQPADIQHALLCTVSIQQRRCWRHV
jgi:hypothetical protein